MECILCIETSNQICSVALFQNGSLISNQVYSEPNAHANVLFTLIDNCLAEAKVKKSQLSAMAISKGPGSYTGLRIGVAAAKGYCQALAIPLISVSSLETMVLAVSDVQEYEFIIPMFDARRMEVFTAVFDSSLNEIAVPAPLILEEKLFDTYLEKGKVLFIGNGATKWKTLCDHNNAFYADTLIPLAANMGKIAHEKCIAKSFEDIAYFVPEYLKPVHIL